MIVRKFVSWSIGVSNSPRGRWRRERALLLPSPGAAKCWILYDDEHECFREVELWSLNRRHGEEVGRRRLRGGVASLSEASDLAGAPSALELSPKEDTRARAPRSACVCLRHLFRPMQEGKLPYAKTLADLLRSWCLHMMKRAHRNVGFEGDQASSS